MKNIVLKSLLLLTVVSVIACSSDDESGIDSNLFATWTLSSTVFRDCTNSDLNDVINETCTDNNCEKMVLNSDFTYQMISTAHGVDEISSGTFEVRGNQIQLTPASGSAEVVEFIVSSSSLTFSTDILACQQDLVYSK